MQYRTEEDDKGKRRKKRDNKTQRERDEREKVKVGRGKGEGWKPNRNNFDFCKKTSLEASLSFFCTVTYYFYFNSVTRSLLVTKVMDSLSDQSCNLPYQVRL